MEDGVVLDYLLSCLSSSTKTWSIHSHSFGLDGIVDSQDKAISMKYTCQVSTFLPLILLYVPSRFGILILM